MNNYHPFFKIGELIAKHLQGGLPDGEKEDLERWLLSDPHNLELFKKLSDISQIDQQLEIYSATEKEKAWENIVERTGFKEKTKKKILRPFFPYAAAVALLLTLGVTISRIFHKKKENITSTIHQADLLPGSNKAVLTLANGKKIVLDDSKNGKIANGQNVSIEKTRSGQIVYHMEGGVPAIAPPGPEKILAFNMIATPRGGQYEVVLPDGTKVWLNAASSLRYPETFAGNRREVELTGEAYFEVAKNNAQPFFVQTATQTVEVTGTHFDIDSYADEAAAKTTLLEGSVEVRANYGRQKVTLRPGQQAVNTPGVIRLIPDADTEEAMAWKNGKFLFHNTELRTIMRQLSRWYDVDVEYRGPVVVRHYWGRISRNVPASQVFRILKTSGLNFTIDGRKIIVKS